MSNKKFDNHQFKRLRKLLGDTQAVFAEKLNTSQQTIAMIENNNRAVPSSIRENFYKKFGLSYDEAIQCKTKEELNIALNKKIVVNSVLNDTQVVAIKFYSNIQAAAGLGNYTTNNTQSEVLYFDKRWLKNIIGINPQNAFIIQAQGESMDSGLNKIDDIKDGDLLMVDTSKLEGNNKIYVISLNNEIRVKRLFYNLDGSLTISSNNSKYQDEQYKAEDANFINIQVLGRVVWNGSKENV